MSTQRPIAMLLLGAGVALSAVFLMSQGGTVQPSSAGPWPPARQNVVNLIGSVSVEPGQSAIVYTVPKDRWLTITEAKVTSYPRSGVCGVEWREVLEGVATTKMGYSDFIGEERLCVNNPSAVFRSQSPELGWTFRPGSQVGLYHRQGGESNSFDYSIMGYETRN